MLTPDEVALKERCVISDKCGWESIEVPTGLLISLLATIEALREELCGRAVILRHTEYWLGVRTEERDAQAALVRELREELAQAQNALANAH
jgi:hypothetical protein